MGRGHAVRVCGCDYSSKFVDLVTVPLDGPGAPVWHRFPLVGADAFDRARSVAQAVPGPTSVLWDDILSVGIEDPRGQNAGAMYRVQGAILARIPARMLVRPFIPSEWRKGVGLKGNASKETVASYAHSFAAGAYTRPDWPVVDALEATRWPQDAWDAYCIALATLRLLDREKAA